MNKKLRRKCPIRGRARRRGADNSTSESSFSDPLREEDRCKDRKSDLIQICKLWAHASFLHAPEAHVSPSTNYYMHLAHVARPRARPGLASFVVLLSLLHVPRLDSQPILSTDVTGVRQLPPAPASGRFCSISMLLRAASSAVSLEPDRVCSSFATAASSFLRRSLSLPSEISCSSREGGRAALAVARVRCVA